MYMCIYIWLCTVYVFVCTVYVCIFMYVCNVCVYIYACICMCMCVYVCISMIVYVYVCMCLCMFTYIYEKNAGKRYIIAGGVRPPYKSEAKIVSISYHINAHCVKVV